MAAPLVLDAGSHVSTSGSLSLSLSLMATYRFRRRYRSFRRCHRHEVERTRGSRRRRLFRDRDAPLGGRCQQLSVRRRIRGCGLGRDRSWRVDIWACGRDRYRRWPRHVAVGVVVEAGVELEVENGTQGRCSWLLLADKGERRQSSTRLQHLGGGETPVSFRHNTGEGRTVRVHFNFSFSWPAGTEESSSAHGPVCFVSSLLDRSTPCSYVAEKF
jgi:hypothetical protein